MLWTNPNQTSAQDAFDVSLDLSKYTGILVYGKCTANANAICWPVYVLKGATRFFTPFTTATASYAMGRNVTVTATNVHFSRGANNLEEHVNYNPNIPTQIYGV